MTAKVTYQGEPDGPESVRVHGFDFKVGESVEVDDGTAIRLMGNPHFKRQDTKALDDAAKLAAEKIAAERKEAEAREAAEKKAAEDKWAAEQAAADKQASRDSRDNRK